MIRNFEKNKKTFVCLKKVLYLCETKEINAVLDKWLSRLPFTEKITGSTPVHGTKHKIWHKVDYGGVEGKPIEAMKP